MSYIEDMITFSKFLIKFRSITRVIDFSYDTRSENDAEHSWYLAMMAWYIISTKKLNLSLEKVLLYCIAHDLVEIYAGDTSAFTSTEEQRRTKIQREHEAFEKMKQEFHQFPEMLLAIEQYEKKGDPESIFVYALDKVTGPLIIYGDDGYCFRKNNVNYKEFRQYKDPRIMTSKEVNEIRQELVTCMEERKEILFPS